MASAVPWDIYADQLLPLGYGHPLWLPDSYGREVHIGDVGWLINGGFRALINSTKEHGGLPAHAKVPLGFQPLDPETIPPVTWPAITLPMICSRSIHLLDAVTDARVSGGLP